MFLFWTIIFRSTCIPKLLSVPRWLLITHQSWCRKSHLKAKRPITGTISVEWRSDGALLTCRIWVSFTLKKTPVIHKLQPQMLILLTNRGRPVSFSLEVTLGPKGELFILTLNLVSYVKWSVGIQALLLEVWFALTSIITSMETVSTLFNQFLVQTMLEVTSPIGCSIFTGRKNKERLWSSCKSCLSFPMWWWFWHKSLQKPT